MTDRMHPARLQPGHWRRLDHQDGLTHDCRCVLVDRQNRLWIGSRRMGLTCYDGTDFHNYTTADGLAGAYVRRLCEDADGVLWIGSDDGLTSFDGDRFVTHRFPADDPSSVRALLATTDGRLLVGGRRGLYECRGGALSAVPGPGRVGASVRALAEDHDGALWVGLDTGVQKINGEGVETFDAASGAPRDLVTCLAVDSNGDVWTGAHGGGASRYDGSSWHTYSGADGLPDDRVACIGVAPDGAVWVGTAFDGAARFDGDRFTAYTTQDGLAHNYVHDIATDLEGGLWFACWHGGPSRLHQGVTVLTELPVQEAMTRDPEGRIWWGSGAELHSSGEDGDRAYTMPDRVQCILADSQGGLWVGTYLGGVHRFPDRARLDAPEAVYPSVDEDGPASMALCEDQSGAVWLGCDQGLWRNDGTDVRKYTVDDGLPTNHVTSVCATKDGAIWWGGYNGGGIARYDGESWRAYSEEDGLPDESVLDITEGAGGRLWVGTRNGLACLHDGSLCAATADDGLPAAAVKRVVVGDDAQVWVATLGGGVARYDGVNVTVLTEDDGLPSNHVCDMVAEPDGSMVLATYRGICRYTRTHARAPGIRITAAESRERVATPTTIEVPEGSGLRVTFAGASLLTTQMRYAYRLRGRDDAWSATWDQSVHYSDLDVGEYTFEVVAVSRDLVVSESPASLAVTVLPDPRDEQIAALEAAVHDSEQVRLALVDAIPDLMFRLDRTGRFTHFESSSQVDLFMRPDEFMRRCVQDLFPRDHATATLRHIHAALATGSIQTHEYAHEHDGQLRHYECRYTRCGTGEVLAIVRDVTERVVSDGALRGAEREREMLLQQLLTLQEEERGAIATALHEGIGQELVALQMAMGGLEAAETVEDVRGMLTDLRRDMGLASEALRQLSMDLRPSALDDIGLTAALRYEATAMELKTGMEIGVWADTRTVPRLSPTAESRVYRVARAALRNPAGPGRASRVHITVAGVDDGLHVVVEDDGVGFDYQAVMAGPIEGRYGLTAMREQLAPLAGTLEITSSPDAGTVVGIHVPEADAEAARDVGE